MATAAMTRLGTSARHRKTSTDRGWIRALKTVRTTWPKPGGGAGVVGWHLPGWSSVGGGVAWLPDERRGLEAVHGLLEVGAGVIAAPYYLRLLIAKRMKRKR